MKKEKKDEVVEFGAHIKPTRNQLFVELFEESNMTAAGIIKPDSQIETEPFATVIAVSDTLKGIKAGDTVLMRMGIQADVFKLQGKKYAMLTDFDIVAVIDEVMIQEMKRSHNIKKQPTLEN